MQKYFSKVFALCFLGCASLASAGGNDDPLLASFSIDQFESRDADGANPLVLSASTWVGKDLQKFVLDIDVGKLQGSTEEAELQALYSRAVAPHWDLRTGVRRDFLPKPDRNWLVLGVQGLAPYFIEVDANLYVGESSRLGASLEAAYEFMLTQRLVLLPELEANLYGHNDRQTGAGSGLSSLEWGLRFRYEITREFAPYIGVNHERLYGNSRDFAIEEGEGSDDTQFVIGIKTWF